MEGDMQKTKPGAELPAGQKRYSLKKGDVYRLGNLIQTHLEDSTAGMVAYKPGMSDAGIMKLALDGLKLELPLAAVARTRQALFGHLASEKGSSKQKMEALHGELVSVRRVAAEQAVLIDRLTKRVTELERLIDETEPAHQPSKPVQQYSNGRGR